jgi:hypothetical protein
VIEFPGFLRLVISRSRSGLTAERDSVKSAYHILAGLIAVGVVLQAASIAYASFALAHAVDGGTVIDKNSSVGGLGFGIHAQAGEMAIPLLAVLLFILSFRAHAPNGVKWASVVLFATAIQVLLGIVSHSIPALGWLHGINALVLFTAAVNTARLAAGSPQTQPPSSAQVRDS